MDNQLSWSNLEQSGWTKTISPTNNRVVYVRPSGTMVRQKRDLTSTKKVTLGNILFPLNAPKSTLCCLHQLLSRSLREIRITVL